MSQKKIYFSFCGNQLHDKNVEVLVQISYEKGYKVKYRSTKLDENSAFKAILDSDIVIVLVTLNFFEKSLAIKDFYFALENCKTILCLFTPEIGHVKIKNETVTIMENLIVIKLPEDFTEKAKWIKVINNILERAETVIRDNQKLAVNDKKYKKAVFIEKNVTYLKISAPIEVKFEDMVLERGTIINNNQLAVIAFEKASRKYYILIFNKDCYLVQSIKLKLKKPKLISSNKNNEILITDDEKDSLFLFDENFNIKDFHKFGLVSFNDMTVDEETNDIYSVRCIGKSDIKVIDYKTKSLKKIEWNKNESLTSEKFKPRFIRVVKDRIFIVNASSVNVNLDTREYRVEFGESYIYILDKDSFKIKNFIDLKTHDFCQPWNLIIYNDLNVYTTVSIITDKKYISTGRFLIKLDGDSDKKSDARLCSFLSNDAFIIKDKLLLFIENKFNLYSIFLESYL
jgi:hypothetical protein